MANPKACAAKINNLTSPDARTIIKPNVRKALTIQNNMSCKNAEDFDGVLHSRNILNISYSRQRATPIANPSASVSVWSANVILIAT